MKKLIADLFARLSRLWKPREAPVVLTAIVEPEPPPAPMSEQELADEELRRAKRAFDLDYEALREWQRGEGPPPVTFVANRERFYAALRERAAVMQAKGVL